MQSTAGLNFVTPNADNEVRFVLDNYWSGTEQRAVEVAVRDLRNAPPPDLFADGFTLVRMDSIVEDFDDQEEVERRWLPAARETILTATGGRWATLFAGPLRRFSNRHPRSTGNSISAPARAVHSDLHADFRFFDIGTQPEAVRAAAEVTAEFGDEAPPRWRVFNLWSMISPPPQDNTLTMCRLPSIEPADILAGKGYFDVPDLSRDEILHQRGDRHDFDITFFRENTAQDWCYFSDLLPGEALIFSTFDPTDEIRLGRTPHAAIDLEWDADRTQPRRSIEIRALVAY